MPVVKQELPISEGGKVHNEAAMGGEGIEKSGKSDKGKDDGGGTSGTSNSHSSSKSHRSSHKKRKNKSRHRYVLGDAPLISMCAVEVFSNLYSE